MCAKRLLIRQNASFNLLGLFPSYQLKCSSTMKGIKNFAQPKSEKKLKYEPELVCNCSLMEYDTLIQGKRTPREAVDFIKETSDTFYDKVGGVICVSGNNITNVESNSGCEKTFRIPIKWVMPMKAFMSETIDADEMATWISKVVPPAEPSKMGSTRGIYVDVDLSILREVHDKIAANL